HSINYYFGHGIMTKSMKYLYLLFFIISLFSCKQSINHVSIKSEWITNPLFAKGADPWITQKDGIFYYCYSQNNGIHIRSGATLSELQNAEERIVWKAPDSTAYSREIWAPELHWIDQRWYIYFAADDGANLNHRMHILRSEDTSIESDFAYAGELTTPDDRWSIDGTIFSLADTLYFLWSGWEGDINVQQNLYIAGMESPTKINSERTLISSPEYEWEKRGSSETLPTINEGPQILRRNGKLFIIYSASGSWSDYYCLGLIKFLGGNPLLKSSWQKKNIPVFEGNNCTISPGHASFLTINDQDYIFFHHAQYPGSGWKRAVSIQPFTWDQTEPHFGSPLPDGSLVKIAY
ncbi:MAG: family 43 glycosylhydrolase, partial [Saprospiraceae bacterium]|nr:family 43 glycosylhydrolase [Saprospiraceae bacterium]